jgi:magnesium and cobalt transporter
MKKWIPLAGWYAGLGHLPARGESIDIDGYQFKVAMADSRRIIQVHVKLPDDAPQPKLEE